MSLQVMRGMFSVAAVLLSSPNFAGEAPAPATPPVPLKVSAEINAQQITDWRPYLEDFQSSDAAKQQAAVKVFIENGGRAHGVLGALLKNPNPDIAKRANDVRQQIDQRAMQMYREAEGERQKSSKEPLTAAGLETLRQTWIRMSMYASQQALKQYGFQAAAEMQKQIEGVKAAQKQIEELDAMLKAAPDTKGLARASMQQDRATALKTLQRDEDAQSAALDAATASGKEGRLTPGILKLLVEIYSRRDDKKNIEATCRRIMADYPRSLELKFAHKTLTEQLIAEKRWDDAFAAVKAFIAAFPIDEDAQESAYGLMETLMSDELEYKRVGVLSDWLIETLPIERLKPEAAKLNGGCNEYILKDYAKAQRSYALLRDRFTDLISADDMKSAMTRLTAKAEGKFPKEPQETDVGPAGALALFLKAYRTRDLKLVAEVVPKEDAEDAVESLKDGSDEKVPGLTFADYILKKAEVNEKDKSAKLLIDYYEAGSDKPKPITQIAVLEEGKWKIRWEDPEAAPEEEISTKIPLGGAKPPEGKVFPDKP